MQSAAGSRAECELKAGGREGVGTRERARLRVGGVCFLALLLAVPAGDRLGSTGNCKMHGQNGQRLGTHWPGSVGRRGNSARWQAEVARPPRSLDAASQASPTRLLRPPDPSLSTPSSSPRRRADYHNRHRHHSATHQIEASTLTSISAIANRLYRFAQVHQSNGRTSLAIHRRQALPSLISATDTSCCSVCISTSLSSPEPRYLLPSARIVSQ